MRRRWLSSASVFALIALIAGGCERRHEPPVQRAPRVVESTTELFIVDDAQAAKEMRDRREIVADWTIPVVATVRPPPRARPPKAAPVEEPLAAEPPPALAPSTQTAPPPEERVTPAARNEPEPSPRPQKGAHETAIQWTVAIGATAVGLGSSVAITDSPGDQIFARGLLVLGLASLSTAFVLHVTEPASKPTVSVTFAPGMLGVRGTF